MSFRYAAGINKPGFNPLAAQGLLYNLYGWGDNGSGQLGLGNITTYSSPKQIGSLTTWSSIGAGPYHSSSIKTDSTLWVWGDNGSGQLGLGNTTNYSSPKQVGVLTNWRKAVGRLAGIIAYKTDGTLWVWGAGSFGKLGLGNSTGYSSPKQVGSLTTWSAISGGSYHTAAIKTDGTLWMWGYNNAGQLGLNNTTNYSSPMQVGALTNWSKVYCNGLSFSSSIKTDGTLWTWGGNSQGQLGHNNTTSYSSPKQVGSLTTWLNVAGGNYFVLATKTDGTLWSWGYNADGQLGLGNTTNYSSPKQVGALTNWLIPSQSTSSGGASRAIKTDGTLWAWGRGDAGALGLGNTTAYSSPKQVGSNTGWIAVDGGVFFTLAIG